MGERITIVLDADGRWPTVSLRTRARHTIVLQRPAVQLQRLYHDDRPVQNATFELELTSAAIVKGTLDENGRATLAGLPAPPKRVRFGLDERPYARVDQEDNPEYRPHTTTADIEALVSRSLAKP